MKVYHFLIIYVLLNLIIPCILHYNKYQIFNIHHIGMTFFLTLNILICLWEISLGFNINKIEKESKELKKDYIKKEFKAVLNFFFANLTLSDCFSFSFWTKVWSTYSLYDPSYANRESFGFFIDVGNGWSTIIPSLLFLIGMTYDIIPARALGIIGILSFYQELYGTIIYFLSFILNKRYKGKTITEMALFVGLSNGLWFFFPLFGIIYSIDMIYNESFNIFRLN